MPAGQGIVALKFEAFRLVLVFWFSANFAAKERRLDDAVCEIVEVERITVPGLEDRQACFCEPALVYLWQVRPLSKVAYASDAFDAELRRRNQPTRTIVDNSSTDVGGSGTPVGDTV